MRRENEQIQEGREQLRSQLFAERSANQRLKQEHDDEVRELQRKITMEQEKRNKKANERTAKNDKLIEGFGKEMIEYEK